MRSGFAADAASLWPDAFAPSAGDAATPEPTGHADAAPPTRAVEPTPEPAATPEPPPAKAPAPKAVTPEASGTFTLADVEARVADATKRARADQSAMAKQLTDMQRRLEARESAFGELVQQYRGTEVEGAALRQWMQSENAATDRATEEARTAATAQQQASALADEKAAAANGLYQEQYGPLLYEAGQLGLAQNDLLAIIDGVLKSADFAPFHEAFSAAPSLDDALRVAKPGYVLMAKEVKAQLQQRKLDSLKEPEAKPKPERTQAHGTGGAVVDPLDRLPIGQRGVARLRGGLAQDAMRAYQLEQ